jgi:hypothetical protein
MGYVVKHFQVFPDNQAIILPKVAKKVNIGIYRGFAFASEILLF